MSIQALNQAYYRIHPIRQEVSRRNVLKEVDLWRRIPSDPALVVQGIKDSTRWKSQNTKNNLYKFISKVLRETTVQEKCDLLGLPFPKEDEISEAVVEEIERIFNEKIHRHFKEENHKTCTKVVDDQMLTQKDLENLVSVDRLKMAMQGVLVNTSPDTVIKNQFFVALGIYLEGSKVRRDDIGVCMLERGDESPVWLNENCTKIYIATCTKTMEANVTIELPAYIQNYVKMLRDQRRVRGQNYLFVKMLEKDKQTGETLDQTPDCQWFGREFARAMKRTFDKNVTVRLVRIALGIHVSRRDNGDYAYQRWIEDYMGHSYEIHQRYYNLFKSLSEPRANAGAANRIPAPTPSTLEG